MRAQRAASEQARGLHGSLAGLAADGESQRRRQAARHGRRAARRTRRAHVEVRGRAELRHKGVAQALEPCLGAGGGWQGGAGSGERRRCGARRVRARPRPNPGGAHRRRRRGPASRTSAPAPPFVGLRRATEGWAAPPFCVFSPSPETHPALLPMRAVTSDRTDKCQQARLYLNRISSTVRTPTCISQKRQALQPR